MMLNHDLFYFVETPNDSDLVCVSRELSPEHILTAYRQGIFPWHCDEEWVYWFCTQPRTVLFPEKLHIGRSLRKTLRQQHYRITLNQCFADVVEQCAQIERAGQDGSWIAPIFQQAYTQLHHMGFAHSVECWYPDAQQQWQLAGGFYGVQIGRVFFGESMFAKQSDASKVAFACAVPYFAQQGIALIDCQQDSAHLARFGSQPLSLEAFQAQLAVLTAQPLTLSPAQLAQN